MAKEVLAVPEQHLLDVIKIIRAGIAAAAMLVDPEVVEQLSKWCDDEERYMRGADE